jgi:hypothetical protein
MGDADIKTATKPSCPQAILQFQHGTFIENADGSLSLTPFSVDGRQLQSNPCAGSKSTYTRYTQPEIFQVCISSHPSQSTLHPTNQNNLEIPSLRRPLHQTDPSRPLQIRRFPYEPHVPRL